MLISEKQKKLLTSVGIYLKVSRKELTGQMDKAMEESLRNQATLLTIQKADEIASNLKTIIVALSLMVNSVFFQYLLQRRFKNQQWVGRSHRLHLYAMSAYFMPIVLSVGYFLSYSTIALDIT